jgi:hypothetical protein
MAFRGASCVSISSENLLLEETHVDAEHISILPLVVVLFSLALANGTLISTCLQSNLFLCAMLIFVVLLHGRSILAATSLL